MTALHPWGGAAALVGSVSGALSPVTHFGSASRVPSEEAAEAVATGATRSGSVVQAHRKLLPGSRLCFGKWFVQSYFYPRWISLVNSVRRGPWPAKPRNLGMTFYPIVRGLLGLGQAL